MTKREQIRGFDPNAVRGQVERVLDGARAAHWPGDQMPLVVTFETAPLDILQWLKCRPISPRVYWYDREGDLEIGGSGAAVTVSETDPDKIASGFSKLSALLREHPQRDCLRFVGGHEFCRHDRRGEQWHHFPALWFVLPEVSTFRIKQAFFFSLALMVDPGATSEEVVSRVWELLERLGAQIGSRTSDGMDARFPGLVSRTDYPDQGGWNRNVSASLRAIEEGRLEKVVLARRTDLLLERPVDPVDYLHALKRANRRCYCFLFEPTQGEAFVGATPERLLRIEKDRLISEALSGTIGRGDGPDDDRRRCDLLLANPKERLEHRFVAEDLAEKFRRLTKQTALPGRPEILELANVKHLIARVSGVLRNGVSVGEIVSSLHPTPAVGGRPFAAAMDLIRSLEPFTRGWYAGPVGMISRDLTDLAVGIRSVLVAGEKLSLFAGAGIVKGSVPQREWEEIEEKVSTALSVLSGRVH